MKVTAFYHLLCDGRSYQSNLETVGTTTKKLWPDWREELEREISLEDLFRAVVVDFGCNTQGKSNIGKMETLNLYGLLSNFPHLAKVLFIPQIPDKAKQYVQEPCLKKSYYQPLEFNFGFFHDPDGVGWAVMTDCYANVSGGSAFQPLIGIFETDKCIILPNYQPNFEISLGGFICLKYEGKTFDFGADNPCYPWIIENPKLAYIIGELQRLLKEDDANPLTGLLTTRDGSVRTCANQIKNILKSLSSFLKC
jgi:hypothetical protein